MEAENLEDLLLALLLMLQPLLCLWSAGSSWGLMEG